MDIYGRRNSMGKYDNDFCNHPKKSVIKTFGDEVNLNKFYHCCDNARDLIKKKGTIADVYCDDLGCPSSKTKSDPEATLRIDLCRCSRVVKERIKKVRLRIEEIEIATREMETERARINTFIDKLHCYIDTDIPHIINKETGLEKVVLYYDRNIKELRRFSDCLEIYIDACTRLQGKSKYDAFTRPSAKKYFSSDF